MLRQWILPVVIVSGLLMAACGPRAPAAPRATPTPVPTPTAAPTPTPTAAVEERRVNLDKILPPAPGRDLVLMYCTTCHTLAPIVLMGPLKGENQWQQSRAWHETGRYLPVPGEQMDLIFGYLASHFGPGKPVPEFPAELKGGWIHY